MASHPANWPFLVPVGNRATPELCRSEVISVVSFRLSGYSHQWTLCITVTTTLSRINLINVARKDRRGICHCTVVFRGTEVERGCYLGARHDQPHVSIAKKGNTFADEPNGIGANHVESRELEC